MAGDFSPLTIDVVHAGARFAPPALLVAVAIGLGTLDMPVPSIAEWEWVNWKFPRPVRAGETIYARWTLTQKRPPVGGAPTAIVVWRVDVHTADGALCAEGEVGASVRRRAQAARQTSAEAAPAAPAPRRRRGRRSPAVPKAAEAPAPPVEAPAKIATPEKTGTARRRRRRRPRSSSSPGQNGPSALPATPAGEPTPTAPVAVSASTGSTAAPGALSRVIKRLRRT